MPASTRLILISLVLLGLSVFNGIFIFYNINKLREDAGLINLQGVVRGGIQRATKLVIMEIEADQEIHLIDNLLNQNSLFKNENIHNYQRYQELKKEWEILLTLFKEYRNTPNNKLLKEKIFQCSERCWKLADLLVHKTQFQSEEDVNYLSNFMWVFGLNIAGLVLLIIMIKSYIRDQLEFYIRYDSLTQTLNRREFDIQFKKNILRFRKQGVVFCLLLMDIDNFKRINDTYGHDIGDLVLKEVTKTIRDYCRKKDTLYRIGGEEFALILSETDLPGGVKIANRLLKEIPKTEVQPAGNVTVSMGLAQILANEGYESLYRRCDQGLYYAKTSGKNRLEIT